MEHINLRRGLTLIWPGWQLSHDKTKTVVFMFHTCWLDPRWKVDSRQHFLACLPNYHVQDSSEKKTLIRFQTPFCRAPSGKVSLQPGVGKVKCGEIREAKIWWIASGFLSQYSFKHIHQSIHLKRLKVDDMSEGEVARWTVDGHRSPVFVVSASIVLGFFHHMIIPLSYRGHHHHHCTLIGITCQLMEMTVDTGQTPT